MKQVYNFSKPENLPPNAWYHSQGNKIVFGCRRYDSDLLTFQIIFFILPCLACSYFIFTTQDQLLLKTIVYLIILSLISFWVLTNFRNKIVFTLEDGKLKAQKGYPLTSMFSINIDQIESVHIRRKSGTTGRRAWKSGTVEVKDLVIKLKGGEEIDLGSFFQDIHKFYFKFVIEYHLTWK